mgnify:CR=1 FL=1
MADRNEADALFATKRKKQQEKQAEQERREEMSRKKAEMEAEIRRLEEEARRQKEKQEEDRRQAEEEARRVKQEAEEAEARAKRAQEMAEEAKRKQEEVRREEERRVQEKREEEKRARERAAQEKAQAKEAAKAETRNGVKEKPARPGRDKADIQPGKKLPVLPLAIGVIAVLVICLVLFSGGKKGGVFGTDCDRMAAKQVLSYDVFYPESFEEAYDDGGVYLKYGSVENGDFSFVYVLGSTQEDMNYMTESTDPTDLIHVMEEYVFGMNDKQVYKMTTGSGRSVYCSEYISFDISSITDQEEGVMASTSIMMLPLEGEYLVAVYGTMKTSYEEPLEEVTASILDNTY